MIRTDLAIECREMFGEEISGVESSEKDTDGIKVTHVKITTDEGAERIGKPKGNYVTIEIEGMLDEDEELCNRGAEAVSEELQKLMNLKEDTSVLVVGLGNRYITPDSIGPEAVGKLFVTRHLTEVKDIDFEFNFRSVSAIAPGVLGLTGIETGEIVEGIKNHVNPDIIIAVDALASRKLSRLGTTVQISDTGINPGSGVGNNRKELSQKSMGVPVIAIGVPMVVDALTVADDVYSSIMNKLKNNGENINSSDFLSETFSEKNMIVTPNNVDVLAKQASEIIAEGINKALHA